MPYRRVLVLGLIACSALLSGCATSCGPTSDKLASLRRGMSVQEASTVLGCEGSSVARSPESAMTTFEWSGPGAPVVNRTQLDFEDGRLLSFTTDKRYGL
ncbi:MAG TPA: hypothetical protein VMI56_09935 [Reyranella sp.]|nr:hypothetical protein [Reyranella sp.]